MSVIPDPAYAFRFAESIPYGGCHPSSVNASKSCVPIRPKGSLKALEKAKSESPIRDTRSLRWILSSGSKVEAIWACLGIHLRNGDTPSKVHVEACINVLKFLQFSGLPGSQDLQFRCDIPGCKRGKLRVMRDAYDFKVCTDVPF